MSNSIQSGINSTHVQLLKFILFGWIVALCFLTSCNNKDTEPNIKYTTIVMTTDLVNDSAAIKQYEFYHSKQGVWPEIKKANELSGIKEIQIYRFNNRLVMMYSYPENTDLTKMDSLYNSAGERVKQWGAMMNKFQKSIPGTDTSRKWVTMKLIHHYKNGEYY